MKVFHAVPGLDEQWSGIAVAAKLLSEEQGALCVEIKKVSQLEILEADEVWVHSCWTPCVWRVCCLAIKARKKLVRMLHGNLDPVRLKYHGWKKWLVGPIERWCLRRCDRIVATCEAEKGWIKAYLRKRCPEIEVTDIKRFFKLGSGGVGSGGVVFNNSQLITHNSQLHLLYLGRRHPLKGLEYLEEAVRQISSVPRSPFPIPPQLKIVSNAFGDEKEKVWEWCDVLVLPTLSENFGLVVAEALERGKRVITTDGAPAWGDGLEFRVKSGGVGTGIWSGYGGRLIYLKGYREGSDDERVKLLRDAIERLCK